MDGRAYRKNMLPVSQLERSDGLGQGEFRGLVPSQSNVELMSTRIPRAAEDLTCRKVFAHVTSTTKRSAKIGEIARAMFTVNLCENGVCSVAQTRSLTALDSRVS